MKKTKAWIEAMRLRTLPVSISGVIAGTACAIYHGKFDVGAAMLCLTFAILAQIASNFANEYFDFVNGLDKKGREGFRRGVTEGDLSAKSMLVATLATLSVAGIIGIILMLIYGEWWLICVGILIAVFAIGYSAGPYPLSHHGLGDIAVIIFFGIIPVTLTCSLQTGYLMLDAITIMTSVAIGLMGANVLIVNNYRDCDDDRAVNKHTTVVIFGRKIMSYAYLISGVIAIALMTPLWIASPLWVLAAPATYLIIHLNMWLCLRQYTGVRLNPILGKTAIAMFLFSILLLILIASMQILK